MSRRAKAFLIYFVSSLGLWYFIYEVFLKPSKYYDYYVIDSLASHGAELLRFFGHQVNVLSYTGTEFRNYVQIQDSEGVIIGPGCDGLILIALLVIFVLSAPGKLKNKLWFIPLGVLILYVANLIRVASLAWIVKFYPEILDFNHDYTFKIILFALVFVLWRWWISRFSKMKT